MKNPTLTKKTDYRPFIIKSLMAFLLFSTVFFLIKDALPYIRFQVEAYGETYWSVKWWLAGHILGGSLALLLGLFQFVPAIRNRYLKLHRTLGKVYILSILVGSFCALYMASVISPRINVAWSISLIFLAVPWLVTVLMAYRMIRLRRIQQHREWMIRSYVVTFGFVIFRFVENHPFIESIMETVGERAPTVGWFCWAVPLLFTEVVLQWNKKK